MLERLIQMYETTEVLKTLLEDAWLNLLDYKPILKIIIMNCNSEEWEWQSRESCGPQGIEKLDKFWSMSELRNMFLIKYLYSYLDVSRSVLINVFYRQCCNRYFNLLYKAYCEMTESKWYN